jgi:hypothetical protein
MDAPISRVGAGCNAASAQKNGPCGVNQRTSKPTEFRPGQTITVQLNETVDHPSHYRIAFNPNGDTFEDPTSVDDKSGAHPHVLLDDIMDVSAAKQSVEVVLPNVTCDNCTLQLIQVMYDKGGNGFGGRDSAGKGNDDLYYACADIVLKGTPVGAPAADAGAPRDAGTANDSGATVDATVGRGDAGREVDAAMVSKVDAAAAGSDVFDGAPRQPVSDAASSREGGAHSHEDDAQDDAQDNEDEAASTGAADGCSAAPTAALVGRSSAPFAMLLTALSLIHRRRRQRAAHGHRRAS